MVLWFLFLCIVAAFHVVYTQKEAERGRGASSQSIVLEMGNLAVDGGILISCTYTIIYIRDEDQFYVAR